ncbi:MAG: protein O-mannosyl-transferase family, partial [bacterium]
DKNLRRWGFIFVFLVSFAVYLWTMAPTVSFWDCGEFIATSYILGVAHPPGTPLQILIGRIFSMIPFSREIAYRVNMISTLSASLAVSLVYLMIVKVIGMWQRKRSLSDIIIQHAAGLVGAFSLAFSFTFWDNSVEAEVYAPCSAIMSTAAWLALVWQEKLGTNQSKKILLLIAYMLTLSTGIHLTPLLVFPGIILFVLLVDWRELADIKLWTLGVFLAILGIATYLYLMLRARYDPGINEVNPTTFRALMDVVQRKQYGPMQMLPRKTDIETHIGVIPAYIEQLKIYWKYFTWQFTKFPRSLVETGAGVGALLRFFSALVTGIFTAVGIFGFWTHFKHDRKTFAIFALTFIFTSVGLVTYLNLKYLPSDPNPLHQPREVRERDYFFAASFVFYTFFVGIGSWGIMQWLSDLRRKLKLPLTIVAVFVFIVIASVPYFSNRRSHVNRRNNWIANNYGINMLASCEDGSVLFTNGDNDTFPLWFVQEVKRFKRWENRGEKGTMVANLSLLNTDWYIKQLRNRGVPISLTDWQIDNLRPLRLKNGEVLLVRDIAVRDIIATNSGIKLTPQQLFGPSEEFAEVVLDNYKPDKTIYFAVTVSPGNLKPYRSHLLMQGMVYKLVPEKGNEMIDTAKSRSNLFELYNYSSIFDENVYKDDNTQKLISNYVAGFASLANAYEAKGQLEKAAEALEMAERFETPMGWRITYHLGGLYERMGRLDKANEKFRKFTQLKPRASLAQAALGRIYQMEKNYIEAEKAYARAADIDRSHPSGYGGLISLYLETGDTNKARSIVHTVFRNGQLTGKLIAFFSQNGDTAEAIFELDEWLKLHPDDKRAIELRKSLIGG